MIVFLRTHLAIQIAEYACASAFWQNGESIVCRVAKEVTALLFLPVQRRNLALDHF